MIRAVWATFHVGRIQPIALHFSKQSAKREVGLAVDDYDFAKLPILTPEAAALIAVTLAYLGADEGDDVAAMVNYAAMKEAARVYVEVTP